ncbi:putative zinc- or iron-chelating protein [Desulfobotulus alkaliphilus]|uniref:Putative zinc-or iron-chelating protein n=1 Tax=Desulfobotulus alkaliphilus TaxID=622671 RepID=A0A562RY91_9BACT|nr:YkgJ family cysteine cluster protein [Desulfobotulus alkaliphilus]TWI74029.1 putative zinc- or iron-chelating protein [Desulfobotulus alkaliphilus]
MTSHPALPALAELYALQEKTFHDFHSACAPGCALCCTRNVIITSLEAEYILSHINTETAEKISAAAKTDPALPRLHPSLSLNSMAALYMDGKNPPEDEADPSWWPCPLLDTSNKKCTVYTHRPMACRCMISKTRCDTSDAAEMEEVQVVLHTLFLQATEHLDAEGRSGNLLDLLMETSFPGSMNSSMPQNRKIPMLMIPPAFQQKLRPTLEEIHRIFNIASKK